MTAYYLHMWINRDIMPLLANERGVFIQILIGPRQCGKSSLLGVMSGRSFHTVTLDDLQARLLANSDPALFFQQHPLPVVIDEVQYAPVLFPELKRLVDALKKERLHKGLPVDIIVQVRLTGSNQILLDKNVKESLVGRASYYYLNTLSVHEIINAFPDCSIATILFKGGWPELYTNAQLNVVKYLNDYIRSYIEKDIAHSAGIHKIHEFYTVLCILAARTGQLINYSSIAKDSGVRSVTVREWISVLERSQLVFELPAFHTNLNKRLSKSGKLYFLDTGLAARLQGWAISEPLLKSSQAGHLFETLVAAEIYKFCNNTGKSYKFSLWRSNNGEEIDFLLENTKGEAIALDAKMGLHSVITHERA